MSSFSASAANLSASQRNQSRRWATEGNASRQQLSGLIGSIEGMGRLLFFFGGGGGPFAWVLWGLSFALFFGPEGGGGKEGRK